MMFNSWTFLFEVVNFLVLAYVLHRLLYRPLRLAIEQRRTATTQLQQEAEFTRQEAATLRQSLQEQLIRLEDERQEVVRKTQALAESERQKLLTETEHWRQRRLEEVRQELERQRAEALQTLQADAVALALATTERLLREAADTTLHRQLVGRLIETLERLPEEERARLRLDWESEDRPVIETAVDLDADSLQSVNAAVADLTGQKRACTVQLQTSLLGGVRLRIGGHVWDASLNGQLEQAQQVAREVSAHG